MVKLTLSIPGFGKIDSPTGLPSGVPTGGLFTGMGQSVFVTAVDLFLLGAILLSLYYIIRGGINMSTSGGHKEKFLLGRERVRYALIGLIVIFLSIFLANFLGDLFGIKLLNISQ